MQWTVRFRRHFFAVLASVGLLGWAVSADAQSAENVAVIVNDASPASQQIAEYYVRKRGIPASNVFRIKAPTGDSVERTAYLATIEQPIATALAREGLHDRVLYLVLTKGVPLRITGTSGATGTTSSVDSELALLYRRLEGVNVPVVGRVDNPYFLGAREIRDAKPFTHREFDIYLVTRLDAFTVPEVLALIDKGSAPVTEGKIVLDEQDKLVDRAGELWLEAAATRLTAAGQGNRVVLEKTVQGARDVNPVLGYYSWGSNDPRNRVRRFGMGFVAGALAATFVSSDARTFNEPPADWVPSGDWNDRRAFFGGSPQTLIGDLIREGATGVAGHVTEPFLQSTIRPEILFPAYLAGFNLVESFYLAMPHLSWQTVVVGDPLATPFPRKTLTRADIEDVVDAQTTLPGLFSKRRIEVAAAQSPGMAPRAVTLALRADTLLVRGDVAAATVAFEEATSVAPNFGGVHFRLATLYEQSEKFDLAIARYKRVIELQPRNVVALNNLAFRLATTKNAPAEALPFAQQAQRLAPQSGVVLDTLGWVQYLAGDKATAVKTLTAAAKGEPTNAEIRLHSAIALAANGAKAASEFELAEALRLSPALETSPDVRALRAVLEKLALPR